MYYAKDVTFKNFNALNLLFENIIIAGRLKCCGMVDQTVVAYGRLPLPARYGYILFLSFDF